MSNYTITYPVTQQPVLSIDQQLMVKSLSVTIASDQTPIPISGSITVSNPSVGLNNAGLPTSSNLIGGDDGGILRPLGVTYTGGVAYLRVDTSGFISPSAATSTNQVTGNNYLSSIDGKIPSSLTVTSTRLLVDGSGVTQPILSLIHI